MHPVNEARRLLKRSKLPKTRIDHASFQDTNLLVGERPDVKHTERPGATVNQAIGHLCQAANFRINVLRYPDGQKVIFASWVPAGNPRAKRIRSPIWRARIRELLKAKYTDAVGNLRCQMCRCMIGGNQRPWTIDHIMPVAKGGRNYLKNLQPLCDPCNQAKADQIIKPKRQ